MNGHRSTDGFRHLGPLGSNGQFKIGEKSEN